MPRRSFASIVAATLLLVGMISPAGAVTSDVLVSAGSPIEPFSQNKQNEPGLAIDPSNPTIVAAGANDNIDMEACNAGNPKTCPFTAGVGVSGIYFSFNGGLSWTRPAYTGYSARTCPGPAACIPDPTGQIGTLPWYYENGMISNGDPVLAFGPKPDTSGHFAWANGSRLYYSNIATKFGAPSQQEPFSGFAAIAVSRTDDVAAAAAGGVAGKAAWKPPVVVTKQNASVFQDKENLWVDNAASSANFGNAYVCNVAFRSHGLGGAPEPVVFARSSDGGETWSQTQISQAADAANAGQAGGRQGCIIRTDSHGTIYLFWAGALKGQSVQYLARSWDGGTHFERPRAVATVTEVGRLDPVQGRNTMDGVAGARSGSSFATVDIANGAPSGSGATDRIVLAWPDGRDGLNHEKVLLQTSTNGGNTWSTPVTASASGDRPDFAAVAISPDGNDVYLVYDNHMTTWQPDTSSSRPMEGVVRHADWTNLNAWSDVHRGVSGDNRGSSANGLTTEFLGDYNSAMATNDGVVGVWTDVRNAADCPAIDAYRQAVLEGTATTSATDPLRPEPQRDCLPTFGNTDIFGGAFADPTP